MKIYQKLENTIDWNKPVAFQLEALSQYDNISKEEIQEMADTCFKSTEAGILLEYLGFEKLRPFLPLFLEFLQDMNWPAAAGASRMLFKAGKEIIPEIRRVFQEVQNDPTWHYWILVGIIQKFEKDLILEMKTDLMDLIKRADGEGASVTALYILKKQEILTNDEIEVQYQYLLEKYRDNEYATNDLNHEIKPDVTKK